MKKKIQKHIEKQHYVKIFLVDKNGTNLTTFEGIPFEQNDEFILMCDTYDFNYDGIVVIRKRDVSQIRRNGADKFIGKVLDTEGRKQMMVQKFEKLNFNLDGWREMFENIKQMNLPVIVESNYGKNELFQIGPVNSVKKKKVLIDYFNAEGKYDIKPVVAYFEEITFIRIDCDYSMLYYKYAKRIK